ncbi:MAG: site-specific integrase [Rhodospirillales bacterium]|nr:site-specific integrase [Rhodospirillales bacterium]
MPKTQYLMRRGGRYSIRMRVPKDLLAAYAPTKEICRALGTGDLKEARRALTLAKLKIEAEFERKRLERSRRQDEADRLSQLDLHTVTLLVLDWFEDQKKDRDRADATPCENPISEKEIREERKLEEWEARQEMLGFDRPDGVHMGNTIAQRVFDEKGVTYDPGSPAFRSAARLFSKAVYELAAQAKNRMEGVAHTYDPMFDPALRQTQGGVRPRTLKAVIKEFFADPEKSRTPSTIKNYNVILRVLEEEIGMDALITDLDRDRCKHIRDLVRRLPSNATKKAPGVPLREVAVLAEEKGWPLVSPTTINMYMQKLHAILEFARKERYVRENEAEGLYVKENTKAKHRRDPFTVEQLNAIFGAPLYTGCIDDRYNYNRAGPNKPRNARFWIPLVSLWTGMRMNEICQLHLKDVQDMDGVPVILIDVEDNPDDSGDNEKRAKTENSIRYVPVHPVLQKIGFLDFVAERRKSGQVRLFYELKKDKQGGYSKEFSKWFGHFLKARIEKTRKTVFHSFRHCYRDALREADINRAAELQLGGWSYGTTDEIYGKGLNPATLYEAVKKITYPGLDLSHLMAMQTTPSNRGSRRGERVEL